MEAIKTRVISIILVLVFLQAIGTVVYKNLENWSWVDSFYFSTTTLTTIGFGDLHPTSDVSKLFTTVYVLFGVSFVLFSLAVFAEIYYEHAHNRFERRVYSVGQKIHSNRRPWKIRRNRV